ncbi:hypothetical protein [Natribaculum luteum]|uniref:hypothetical protein n=1 Tax=Natribaculum luteum TaxID=1586232 RepID=UPI00366CA358
MSDIPQPATRPYSQGERVQIYLGPDDPDERYHNTRCEVTDIHTDDLDSDTGRELDAYSYSLRVLETDETLTLTFRHHDLVPVEVDK